MSDQLITTIAEAVSRSSVMISLVVVSGAVINSITIIVLARERKSKVRVHDIHSGQKTEMEVVDAKSIQEFTNSVRGALKSQKGDF